MRYTMKYFATLILISAFISLHAADKQKITVEMDTPSTAWTVSILEVYQTKTNIVVLSQLKSVGIGGAAISRVKDSVSISGAKLPVKHYVLGKTWNWPNKGFNFSADRKAFDKAAKNAKQLYKAK